MHPPTWTSKWLNMTYPSALLNLPNVVRLFDAVPVHADIIVPIVWALGPPFPSLLSLDTVLYEFPEVLQILFEIGDIAQQLANFPLRW